MHTAHLAGASVEKPISRLIKSFEKSFTLCKIINGEKCVKCTQLFKNILDVAAWQNGKSGKLINMEATEKRPCFNILALNSDPSKFEARANQVNQI